MTDFDPWPERWIAIPDFPTYEISTMKRFRNARSGTMLTPRDNGRGCWMVKLYVDRHPYYRSVEKLYKNALTIFRS